VVRAQRQLLPRVLERMLVLLCEVQRPAVRADQAYPRR
jgi:hypothetical protein